jgi:hypothetical protein
MEVSKMIEDDRLLQRIRVSLEPVEFFRTNPNLMRV